MNRYILLDLSNYHVWIRMKEIKNLKNFCLKSEGLFDPFMLFGHIFTNNQRKEWQKVMNNAFDKWLQGVSRNEFNILYQKTYHKFNYKNIQ